MGQAGYQVRIRYWIFLNEITAVKENSIKNLHQPQNRDDVLYIPSKDVSIISCIVSLLMFSICLTHWTELFMIE